jgi:FtsZ-interacting cell division protein YlmF
MSIFDSVRSRFGRDNGTDNYVDEYDDYDYYDEEGYREPAGTSYGYTDDPVSERDSESAFSISSRGTRMNEHTPLVTNMDVRSSTSTKYTEQPTPRTYGNATGSYRPFLSDDCPPPAVDLSASNRSLRSLQDARDELEALKATTGVDSSVLSASSQESLTRASRAYTSRPAYAEPANRRIASFAPASYEEIVQVSEAFKAGNTVVLSLSRVDGALAKRLLDFSFGVASALDGSVSKLNARTFLIARGGVTLTSGELAGLKDKGIL